MSNQLNFLFGKELLFTNNEFLTSTIVFTSEIYDLNIRLLHVVEKSHTSLKLFSISSFVKSSFHFVSSFETGGNQ